MTPDVSIITCTSDRPEAFALCERWMLLQNHRGLRLEWLITDDGHQPANVMPWATHLRLPPQPTPKESFRHNMLAALTSCRGEKILFVEDDDWYHPSYIALMAALLDIRELVGCARARYYNARHRLWRIHPNTEHASLSTTGFRRSLLPTVLPILRESNFTRPENPQQLDGTLWKRSGIADGRKLLLPDSPHVVSIKGLPGKAGLGIDHRLEEIQAGKSSGGRRVYEADPDLHKLIEWVGKDADQYARFAVQASCDSGFTATDRTQ